MRVSFFGKGGSGKTTMAAGFIKYLQQKDKEVLAIDADINVHLGHILQMDTKYLWDLLADISKYFEENRIKEGKAVIGATPPSLNSKFILPTINDPFFKQFATIKNKTALLTVGTYDEKGIGSSCFHGKLATLFFMYNRLLDNKDFFVITDSTAGIDNLGTSMFCISDINIFVVEPTKKSVNVLKDFLETTKNYKIKTFVIGNKIEDESDIDFIKSEVQNTEIIGFVKSSKDLKNYEKGNVDSFDNFLSSNDEINEKIYNILKNTKKDWDYYYELEKQIYINDANEWYSEYYKQDLPSFIEQEFSYEKVLKKYEINS